MHARTPLQGRDIVCVGFADWHAELWTNQHHLMSRLARGNNVLFIESLGLRRPQVAGRDISRMWVRLRRGLGPPRSTDGLHVLSPLVIPAHAYKAVRSLNARLLPAAVRRASARLQMRHPILWAYVPQAESLIDALDPEVVIYHCVDDIAAHPGIDTESFRAAERRFAARSDLVLASSMPLVERLQEVSTNVVYAPNVADTDLFAGALADGPVDAAVQRLPSPRILFAGAIAAVKLDLPLIAECARLRRDWSFVLVGPVGLGDPSTDVSELEAEPNVHLLGKRRHGDLPAVLRGADVGLIPYAINDLTRSVYPMKVHEYLAAGLPVVATDLPSLAGVRDVAVGGSANDIVRLLAEALEHDSRAHQLARSDAARAHSWDRRLEEIAAALERVGAQPKNRA